jgi:hypothetical protein
MPSRFQARYSGQLHIRTCSTDACGRTASGISSRCNRCANNLRRFGHELQTLPSTSELDKFIRAAEEQRGRLKHLDLAALEARWVNLVDDCRANATPSYKDQKVLSYNGWEREASALIRDIAESITFTRALDLLGAILLLNLERPLAFKSEEAMACSIVELFRRTSRVGCKVVSMNTHNGTIENSYRREMSRNSRLAAARLLMTGLGAAAMALAKRSSRQEAEAKKVREAYWQTVRALEASA